MKKLFTLLMLLTFALPFAAKADDVLSISEVSFTRGANPTAIFGNLNATVKLNDIAKDGITVTYSITSSSLTSPITGSLSYFERMSYYYVENINLGTAGTFTATITASYEGAQTVTATAELTVEAPKPEIGWTIQPNVVPSSTSATVSFGYFINNATSLSDTDKVVVTATQENGDISVSKENLPKDANNTYQFEIESLEPDQNYTFNISIKIVDANNNLIAEPQYSATVQESFDTTTPVGNITISNCKAELNNVGSYNVTGDVSFSDYEIADETLQNNYFFVYYGVKSINSQEVSEISYSSDYVYGVTSTDGEGTGSFQFTINNDNLVSGAAYVYNIYVASNNGVKSSIEEVSFTAPTVEGTPTLALAASLVESAITENSATVQVTLTPTDFEEDVEFLISLNTTGADGNAISATYQVGSDDNYSVNCVLNGLAPGTKYAITVSAQPVEFSGAYDAPAAVTVNVTTPVGTFTLSETYTVATETIEPTQGETVDVAVFTFTYTASAGYVGQAFLISLGDDDDLLYTSSFVAQASGSISVMIAVDDLAPNQQKFNITFTSGDLSVERTVTYIPTAINGIKVSNLDATEIYNLKGMKVDANKLTKGIYIINGKKVLVK